MATNKEELVARSGNKYEIRLPVTQDKLKYTGFIQIAGIKSGFNGEKPSTDEYAAFDIYLYTQFGFELAAMATGMGTAELNALPMGDIVDIARGFAKFMNLSLEEKKS